MEPAPASSLNPKKHHLHIDLDNEYAPICKRSKQVHHISIAEKENLRREGKKHVDLWCDGNLYPINFQTLSPPCFSSPTSLLKFVGDGENGMLGYCKDICNQSSILRAQVILLTAETSRKENTVQEQSKEIAALKEQLTPARTKQTCIGPRQRQRKLKNMECLKLSTGGLKKRIQALK